MRRIDRPQSIRSATCSCSPSFEGPLRRAGRVHSLVDAEAAGSSYAAATTDATRWYASNRSPAAAAMSATTPSNGDTTGTPFTKPSGEPTRTASGNGTTGANTPAVGLTITRTSMRALSRP